MKVKRIKTITVPVLSIKDLKVGDSLFVKFNQTFVEKPDTDKKGNPRLEDGEPVMLTLARVTNLQSGEEAEMVIPFIINKDLTDVEYVGSCFELVKGEKKGRMNQWSVFQIEDPAPTKAENKK